MSASSDRGEAMGSGNERFAELYRNNERAVLAYLLRRLPREDRDDAEDLLAETFAVAWRKFKKIPPGFERAWLYVVAAGVLANKRRADDRQRRLIGRITDEEKASQQAGAAPTHYDLLDAAMASLREQERELLRLVAWEQLSPSEIAVAYGITANAASVRIFRARTNLREAFDRLRGGER